MKTELKLSTDALLACNIMLQEVYESPKPVSKQNRIALSIVFDVAEKVGTKARNVLKKHSLFDTEKKHKITLKFHEAWALEEIIRSNVSKINNVYQNSLLTNIADTINQKLA
ncbi:MAG TPA: hypothetical protein VKZ97_02645 [Flavobacteriaceae bacterium]|nr:hypothetical protein [Flavobacteriaceae bacterium]